MYGRGLRAGLRAGDALAPFSPTNHPTVPSPAPAAAFASPSSGPASAQASQVQRSIPASPGRCGNIATGNQRPDDYISHQPAGEGARADGDPMKEGGARLSRALIGAFLFRVRTEHSLCSAHAREFWLPGKHAWSWGSMEGLQGEAKCLGRWKSAGCEPLHSGRWSSQPSCGATGAAAFAPLGQASPVEHIEPGCWCL